MGQGWESAKPAKKGGFQTLSSLPTSSQQLQDKLVDCFNQSNQAQWSCSTKPAQMYLGFQLCHTSAFPRELSPMKPHIAEDGAAPAG